MIIELIIALVVGILVGTFTGLTPGIHINLVAVILLSISAFLLQITPPIVLVVFIIAMSMTHTFVDYIPSIFLGAPNEDTILSILPGHKLLLKGEGYAGLILTLYGSLTAIPIILIMTPIFIYLLPIIYPHVLRIMPIILIIISVFLISTEKENKSLSDYNFLKTFILGNKKKFYALLIFLLSGFLGIAALNLNLTQPLLPLLTGLFGASTLLISLKEKTKIPCQLIRPLKEITLSSPSFAKSTLASIIASPFTAFLPGLGASQAAIIGTEVIEELDEKEFLFTLGAIDTIVMGLSFIALYSIQKTRTGSAVAVKNLIDILTLNNLLVIITVIIISGIISFFLTIFIAKAVVNIINKINYSKISIIILIIIISFTIYFSGFIGLLIFLVSTSLGISCNLLEIKKSHLMGCLLIPTILIYVV